MAKKMSELTKEKIRNGIKQNKPETLPIKDVRGYVLHRKQILTLENQRTGNKFTYKIERSKNNLDLYFVNVIVCSKFTYLGIVQHGRYRSTKASALSESIQNKAFVWLWNMISGLSPLPSFISVNEEKLK